MTLTMGNSRREGDEHWLLNNSSQTALEMYHTMLRIRRTQEALIREYHPADEMRCPVHFCVGQEAPPTGVCLNLRKDDYTFTGHRSHGLLGVSGFGQFWVREIGVKKLLV